MFWNCQLKLLASVTSSAYRIKRRHAPDAVVVALFAKAGPDCGALLLNDCSLVCNRLGGAHIADKLLDWSVDNCEQTVTMPLMLCLEPARYPKVDR